MGGLRFGLAPSAAADEGVGLDGFDATPGEAFEDTLHRDEATVAVDLDGGLLAAGLVRWDEADQDLVHDFTIVHDVAIEESAGVGLEGRAALRSEDLGSDVEGAGPEDVEDGDAAVAKGSENGRGR
jgi:hypothetical protein